MIVAPSNINQFQNVKTLSEANSFGSLTDYGALKSMSASLGAGYETNVINMLSSAWKRRSLADEDEPPVTEEHFYQSPAARLGLEYDPTENQGQLDYRIFKAARMARNLEYSSGVNRTIRNFASSFAGAMVDPLVFAPISIPTRAAKLGRLHTLAGNRAAAAFHTGKGTFKNVLAVNAAYEVPYAYAMNDLNVQKYTFDHFALSSVMNLGFAGLFGGVHGYVANRHALRNKHILQQDRELTKAFESQNFEEQLRQTYDTDNYIINEVINQYPNLKNWAEGRTDAPLTPEESNAAIEAIMKQRLNLRLQAASILSAKRLADRANKDSVNRLLAVHKRQVQRVLDLFLHGKRSNNLTPGDRAILKELSDQGIRIDQEAQVHPTEESIVPNVGYVSEAAKIYGDRVQVLVDKADKTAIEIAKVRKQIREIDQDLQRRGAESELLLERQALNRDLDALNRQFRSQVDSVTEIVGTNYSRMLLEAQDVVDQIIFGESDVVIVKRDPDKYVRVREGKGKYQGKPTKTLGAVRHAESLVTYVNEPYFFITRTAKELKKAEANAVKKKKILQITDFRVKEGFTTTDSAAFLSVFRTLMHESVHHIEQIDPKSYELLHNIAKDTATLPGAPGLEKLIRDRVIEVGYSVDKSRNEVAPKLIEFAIGQPFFWETLKQQNPELYFKMSRIIDYLADNLNKTVNKYDSVPLNVDIKNISDPFKLATRIATTLTEIKNKASFKAKLKEAMNKRDEQQADLETNPARFDDADLSIEAFESSAKDQAKFAADPISFIDDSIAKLLGGDETVLPSLMALTKLSSEKLPPALNTFVNDMENRGYSWITRDVAESMISKVQAARKRNKQVAKLVLQNKDFDSVMGGLIKLTDEGLPLEVAQRVGYILLDEKGGSAKQIGRVNSFLETEAHAALLRTMHDEVTIDGLRSLVNSHRSAAKRVDQLSTLMDGSRRKNVTLGTSLGTQKIIQKQLDQNPLLDYLVKNDLLEIFLGEDPTKYMSSYINRATGSKELTRLYGSNLKEASRLMHRDIMAAMASGKIPKKWKGVEVWEGLVDIIQKTNRNQLAQMNALGITIQDRKGFMGYSMTYDRAYVKSMGYEAFEAKMLEMIDMPETIKAHGGLMAERPSSTKSGLKDAGKHKKFNKKTFLRGLYNEIVEGEFIQDTDITNPSVLGGYRKAAKVVFKPSKRIDALIEFGNRKNMGRFMLEQIAGRSENIALVKHVGHDANGILLSLIPPQATAISKLKTKATIDQVTGKLDTPVDANLAVTFKAVRQVQNIAMLGGAGFSSLSDIPLVWSTLQYLGVASEGLPAYFTRYQQAVSRQFKGNNKEMSNWFRQQGAAFDQVTRTLAQRVVTDDTGAGGKINTANDFALEANFLGPLTASHQQLFIDMLTSGLAQQLKAKEMNPLTRERLNEFGITDKEIVQLAKYVEKTPDGIDRIGPYNVKNVKLQRKLSGFMNQYMREGVIEPDVGAQALSRLGLQAGTVSGETARLALQYSSFMIAMGRVIYRRFLNGYSGDNKTAGFRNSHMFAYFGMALAAAYLSTVLKDLSKFKEPMNPLDMTEQEWMRVIRQSGLLAYYEPFFNAAQFGTDAAFGPAVGTATDIASLDFGDAVKPYTGQNLPILGPIIKQTAHTANEIIINFLGEETERSASAPIDND